MVALTKWIYIVLTQTLTPEAILPPRKRLAANHGNIRLRIINKIFTHTNMLLIFLHRQFPRRSLYFKGIRFTTFKCFKCFHTKPYESACSYVWRIYCILTLPWFATLELCLFNLFVDYLIK